MRGPPVGIALVPLCMCFPAARHHLTGSGEHSVVDVKRLCRVKAEQSLGGGDLLVTQCRAMGGARVAFGGGGPGDDRLEDHECRLVADRPAALDRGEEGVNVLHIAVGAAAPAAAPVD